MTTTNTITETTYEYHVREWKEFVKYEWDQWTEENDGETPADDIEEYQVELAQTYWSEFEEAAYNMGMDPTQIVNYSAGVFLGEVEEIIGDTRINEISWYDDEGVSYTQEVDMVQVSILAGNADAYADECEEAIKKEMVKMIESGEFVTNVKLAKMIDEKPSKFIGGFITSEMNKEYPELLEVLAQWNKDHTMEEVINLMSEANIGTVVQMFEDHIEGDSIQ